MGKVGREVRREGGVWMILDDIVKIWSYGVRLDFFF